VQEEASSFLQSIPESHQIGSLNTPLCWVMLKLVTLAFIVTTLVGNFHLYWLRNPRGLYIDFGPLNTTLSCELRGHVSLGAPQAHMKALFVFFKDNLHIN
jgi:hypothetical protein